VTRALSRPAAVLFDLDGTLVDSAPDLAQAAERMRVARGLPALGWSAYRAMAGAGARGILGVAFGVEPTDPTFNDLREEFLSNYQTDLAVHTQMFDGVGQLLHTLQQRHVPWGVVTNKAERFAVPLVNAFPSLAAARTVVAGDTTPHPKPHPAPLLEAARRLNCSPTDCWYVGDDERDVQAGRAAGMRTVAAGYGYLGAQPLSAWGADACIESPLDLLKVLELD
jgi:2-phosphoglycolate phosphatase